MRTNTHKNKILDVLGKAHLLSLAAIHKQIPGSDFSTIFRNTEQLCAEKLVRKVTISKDTILYEAMEKNHRHDHFICTDCGTIESIHIPKKITNKGIIDDVLVRGTCNECVGS